MIEDVLPRITDEEIIKQKIARSKQISRLLYWLCFKFQDEEKKYVTINEIRESRVLGLASSSEITLLVKECEGLGMVQKQRSGILFIYPVMNDHKPKMMYYIQELKKSLGIK